MPFIKKSNWTIEDIETYIKEGKSLVEIAAIYGLSRQRIKQICQRHKLPNTVAVRARSRAKTYFEKWGVKEATDLYTVCREKFRAKKANATRVGIPWTVCFGDLTWPKTCPILGISLNYFAEEREEGSPSFDRIDPNLGYVAGNVQIVSWRANRIKNDGSAQEHRLIAEYLDKYAATSSTTASIDR